MKNYSLLNNPLFKWSIIIGLSISLVITVLIVFLNFNVLYLDTSPQGFNNILVIFSLPIKIASSTVVVAGLLGLIYRIELTEKQIKLSSNQDIYRNFIEHKKEFDEVINDIEKTSSLKFTDRFSLYKKVYPKNNPSEFKYNATSLDGDNDSASFLELGTQDLNKIIININAYMDILSSNITYMNHGDTDIEIIRKNRICFEKEVMDEILKLVRLVKLYSIETSKPYKSQAEVDDSALLSATNIAYPQDINEYISDLRKAFFMLVDFCLPVDRYLSNNKYENIEKVSQLKDIYKINMEKSDAIRKKLDPMITNIETSNS